MPSLNFSNALVQINATDLSSFVRKVSINYTSEVLDNTAMGATTRSRIAGLKDATLDIEFNQDFGAGAVDATMFALVGTTSCVQVRPVNACSTATNPSYSGVFVVDKYSPLGQQVGQLALAPVSFKISGNLSRASSS